MKDKTKSEKFIKKFPLITIGFLIIFYFSIFVGGYFIPMFFPDVYENYFFTRYLKTPSLWSISVQFSVFIFTFTMLIISLIKTKCADLSSIPNQYPFNLQNDVDSPQQNFESVALSLISLEEQLKENCNKIFLTGKTKLESDCRSSNSNSSTTHDDSGLSLPGISNDDFVCLHERNDDNSIRYCHTCKLLKPDRVHHCKHCNKCYLRLDHHCFWLDKCIAYDNYKYFILTLFYSCAFLSCCVYIFSSLTVKILKKRKETPLFLSMVFANTITVVLLTVIGVLLLYHINLTLSNFTNFEYAKLSKKASQNKSNYLYYLYDRNISEEDSTEEVKSMFDIGKWNNLTSVLGSNVLLWFLPIKAADESKGLCYKVSDKYAEEIVKSI